MNSILRIISAIIILIVLAVYSSSIYKKGYSQGCIDIYTNLYKDLGLQDIDKQELIKACSELSKDK